jgi:hypothetical protein
LPAPLEGRSYSILAELKGDKYGGMLRCVMDATVWAADGDAAKGLGAQTGFKMDGMAVAISTIAAINSATSKDGGRGQ